MAPTRRAGELWQVLDRHTEVLRVATQHRAAGRCRGARLAQVPSSIWKRFHRSFSATAPLLTKAPHPSTLLLLLLTWTTPPPQCLPAIRGFSRCWCHPVHVLHAYPHVCVSYGARILARVIECLVGCSGDVDVLRLESEEGWAEHEDDQEGSHGRVDMDPLAELEMEQEGRGEGGRGRGEGERARRGGGGGRSQARRSERAEALERVGNETPQQRLLVPASLPVPFHLLLVWQVAERGESRRDARSLCGLRDSVRGGGCMPLAQPRLFSKVSIRVGAVIRNTGITVSCLPRRSPRALR